MLGYKTLASGHVNMSQVLQHPTDLEVPLYMGTKEHGKAVAFVMMMSLCSQPVDQENPSHMMSTDAGMFSNEYTKHLVVLLLQVSMYSTGYCNQRALQIC